MANRFPTELPLSDFTVMIDLLRGRNTRPVAEVVESSWWIVGYGAGMALPSGSTAPGFGDSSTFDSNTVAEMLEGYVADPSARGLPWKELIKFFLQNILPILLSQDQGTVLSTLP